MSRAGRTEQDLKMARGEGKAVKVRQLQSYDCGAACLGSVAGWYGVYWPLIKIRYLCGCTEEGISVKGIMDGAVKMGFYAKAYKSPEKETAVFREARIPIIVHIRTELNMLHFVTVYGLSGGKVKIMDPASGEFRKVPVEVFKEQWTGILILITPGNNFRKEGGRRKGLTDFYKILLFHKKEMLLLLLGSVAVMVCGIFYSILLQQIIDNVILEGNKPLLRAVAFIITVVTLLMLTLDYSRNMLVLRCGIRIDCRLAVAYLRKLFALPLRFFTQYRAGDLNSRIADSFKIREVLCEGIVSVAVNSLAILCCIALMFVYDRGMALLVLLYIPLYVLLFYISKRINKKYNRKLAAKGAEFESEIIGDINVVETIKYYNTEELALEKIERSYAEIAEVFHNGGRAVTGFDAAAQTLSRTLLSSVLVLGGFYSIEGHITAGELVSFYTLCTFFTSPLNSLINLNNLMAEADVSIERLTEILDAEDETLREAPEYGILPEKPLDISFRDVVFSYPGRESIFNGINLTFKSGEMVVITGRSGSGKSTLLSLVMGEHPLEGGEITIGNIAVKNLNIRELRRHITMVPQKSRLINGTFLENITSQREGCRMERVQQICERLNLGELINSMPFGLHTAVNETETKLSGGEIQRIAIARALYRDSGVYLFDEPVTAVDEENRKMIVDQINLLKKEGKSVVVVTHDLEAFYRYNAAIDKIIMIDKTSAHSKVEVCTPSLQTKFKTSDYGKDLSLQGEASGTQPDRTGDERRNLVG